MGWGCLTVVVFLMVTPCLPFAGAFEKADAAEWGALFFIVAYLVACAIAYFYLWPHLYRMFFQSGESEPPSSGSSSSGGSLPVSYQSGSRPRKRKSDDEFPWEAFAYGYLMHELLDDDSSEGASSEEAWGATAWDEDDSAQDDWDVGDDGGGEEFWFDDF